MVGTGSRWQELQDFLAEVRQEKQAAAKAAGSHTEAGGYQGPTTQPIKDVEDGTKPSSEGARSAENEKQVKEEVPAKGVTHSTTVCAPPQSELQFPQGTHKTETGKDPKTEDGYKGTKDDPGTTHPAKADVGPKYSSAQNPYLGRPFEELYKLAVDKVNAVTADVAVYLTNQTVAKQAQASTPTPTPTPAQAAAVGAAAAALAAGAPEQIKVAAEAAADQALEQVARDASLGADLTYGYLMQLHQDLLKQAEEEEARSRSDKPSEKKEGEAGGGGGGPLPIPEGGGMDPSALTAMLGGGGGGGGGGGAPPPPGGGGGNEHHQALNELLMALLEMGYSPEDIEGALAGGGAGGMPPGGGGMPPPGGMPTPPGGGMPPGAEPTMPKAAADRNVLGLVKAAQEFKRQGSFQFKEARSPEERQLRDSVKAALFDIVNRNRR